MHVYKEKCNDKAYIFTSIFVKGFKFERLLARLKNSVFVLVKVQYKLNSSYYFTRTLLYHYNLHLRPNKKSCVSGYGIKNFR